MEKQKQRAENRLKAVDK